MTSSPVKDPRSLLEQETLPFCLELVCSGNEIERDFTIELKQIEGLMEDWLKWEISPLVKYPHGSDNAILIYWIWIDKKLQNIEFILSYHRSFNWLKSACRVYYSYLRQAIHGRVTSEVNIAKMQIAAILSLDSIGLADEWRCLDAYMFLIIVGMSLNLHYWQV